MWISHKRLTIWKTTFAVLLPIYGHKCWKKSSKIGCPDWTTSEPAGLFLTGLHGAAVANGSKLRTRGKRCRVAGSKTSATEGLPRSEAMQVKAQSPLAGVVWKVWGGRCQLRCHPRHSTMAQS
ncbi:hypothetical protein TNCV_3920921 [Trichonephila clavipes]|nr:hypothetical protein TNCV_3920921 [Trichonephila clavipes]